MSRNTSSKFSSPTTSEVGPQARSSPCLMMATLLHSFSTTSSTWLEKNTALPRPDSSRSISFT